MGGRIIKIVNTSAVHLLLKLGGGGGGGGLYSKGAYFRVSTVVHHCYVKSYNQLYILIMNSCDYNSLSIVNCCNLYIH